MKHPEFSPNPADEFLIGDLLAAMAMDIAGKKLSINHISSPFSVRGRNSDNKLIAQKIGWAPSKSLREGMEKTYRWIEEQVNNKKG
ncbi:MAG: hypothetical protein JXA06_06465 [Bacteroidetes bacterium]|nr:hypothetical protein [Bacteroidota bacterium]